MVIVVRAHDRSQIKSPNSKDKWDITLVIHNPVSDSGGDDVLIRSPVRGLFHYWVGRVDGIPPDGDHLSHEGQRCELKCSWLTLGAFPECLGGDVPIVGQCAMSLPLDGGSDFTYAVHELHLLTESLLLLGALRKL